MIARVVSILVVSGSLWLSVWVVRWFSNPWGTVAAPAAKAALPLPSPASASSAALYIPGCSGPGCVR